MSVDIRVLGPIEVLRDGQPVQPRSAKQRSLLAILLVNVNRVVSVEALIDSVWGDDPPATAAGVLQTYVSQLRKILEADGDVSGGWRVLLTVDPGYRLVVPPEQLDVARFESLVEQGCAALRDQRDSIAADCLRQGLALWRGSAFADVAADATVESEAVRLGELRVLATEARIEADLRLGSHAELVGELSHLVRVHPLRERFWGQYMLCLYRVGRQSDALAAYRQLRRILAEEFGLDPSPDLVRLELDILAQAPSLVPELRIGPGARVWAPRSANLPDQRETLRFVGRQQELVLLRDWWSDPAGAPLALVSGESGAGKTRVVTEFATTLAGDGVRVLFGRTMEAGDSAYEPVLGAVRQFVVGSDDNEIAALDDLGAAALARLVPDMAARRPQAALMAAGWSDVDRSWWLNAVAEALVASEGPRLLLVLDDLQWADRPAMMLLARLLEQRGRVRVLGTFREPTDDSVKGFVDLLSDLWREEVAVLRVPIGGLSREEVIDLVGSLNGAAELTLAGRAFAANLHRRTNGNAFFVRETVRHLDDTGVISAVRGLWAAERPLADLGIPERISHVVGRRLARLSPMTYQVLQVAAVVGVEFDVDVVAKVAGRADDEVITATDEAVAAGLLDEDSTRVDRFRFGHILVHEVLLSGLGRSRRTRLEWRTGDALVSLRPADLDELAGRIARHYGEGAAVGDVTTIVIWCRRAASQAMEALAYEAAIHLYERAVDALTSDPAGHQVARMDILIALGRAADLAGDAERRRRSCLAARDLARQSGDPDRLAAAAVILLGSLGPMSADPQVVSVLDEAVAALRQAAPTAQRRALVAELLARLSGYLTNEQPDRSAALAEESITAARQSGDGRALALALMASMQGYALPEEELRARMAEAALLCTGLPDTDVILNVQTNLMAAALIWADRTGYDHHLEEYAHLAAATRSPGHLLLSNIDRAGAAALDGRYAEADVRFGDALTWSKTFKDPSLWGSISVGLFPVNRELGRLAGRVESIRRDVAATPGIPVYQAGLVRALCEAGRLDEGGELLRDMVGRPEQLLWGFLRKFTLGVLAESAELLADGESATSLYRWFEPELQTSACVIVGPNAFFGAVERYLGLLALVLDRPDDAVRHHEVGLDVHERLRAHGWAARSRFDLARTLTRRDRSGDSARAARLLLDADEAAARLGMSRLREEITLLR